MAATADTTEHRRLAEDGPDEARWRLWGPYVAARQWGTVREDYSEDGNAWDYFPFDQAHQRAYRWGEDGIAAISDIHGWLNLGLAVWNGADDRLKERYFGVTNAQGNHGEDVKEYWWHLDATPTHSYSQSVYRYPNAAFPYEKLVNESLTRTRNDPEYELSDTGILESNRFFDITVTYAKASPTDLVMQITATNHGSEPAPLHLVPQIWFHNTWSWAPGSNKPSLQIVDGTLVAEHERLGRYAVTYDPAPRILLCDNETNTTAVFNDPTDQPPHPKDAINRAIVEGDESLLASDRGTKAGLHWAYDAIGPGESVSVAIRLAETNEKPSDATDFTAEPAADAATDPTCADQIIETRRAEADEFYAAVIPERTPEEDRLIARRAFAGLLWSKQLYRYDVRRWLEGDPGQPTPPASRKAKQPDGRNTAWRDLHLGDVILMPDEWEYPWFATWDLAFHCVAMAHLDPDFAKEQLVTMCREWSMHPNGQLPAYEWNFSDVNPPVHAWATWQVYQLAGDDDHTFLTRVLSKLLLNFGWWVNRKDSDDSNLFEGGFLGMDNIGPFDRSAPMPAGQRLEQSDATSWMAFYCLSMMQIAVELGSDEVAWDEAATKFMEHFLAIADAMDSFGTTSDQLWDEDDKFFYDMVVTEADGAQFTYVRVRSLVGLLPLLAVTTLPNAAAAKLPDFQRNLRWMVTNRPDLTSGIISLPTPERDWTSLSMLTPERLGALVHWMLREDEFLSPYGIRSLSAAYRDGTTIALDGQDLSIAYVPGESDSAMFGGNSNWRGPIWFPVNVLLADSLRGHAQAQATDLQVRFPSDTGQLVSLADVADHLDERLISLFRRGAGGRRPSDPVHVPTGPLWPHPTFSEYFHGDTGAGLGASHQTGWTAMVAHLICTRHR